jgi:hypothetical protein
VLGRTFVVSIWAAHAHFSRMRPKVLLKFGPEAEQEIPIKVQIPSALDGGCGKRVLRDGEYGLG